MNSIISSTSTPTPSTHEGVTVVIPTLGRPHLLRRCVQSVLAGALPPERIIVCDQSNDSSTRLVVEGFQGRGSAVLYLHLPSANASAARNAGLYAATTDLVAFTDDDCVADGNWLAALVSAYKSTGRKEIVSGVTGRVVPLHTSRGGVAVSSRLSQEPHHFRAWEGGMERGEWAPWDVGTGANILAPRSILLGIGGFNPRLGPGSDAEAAEDVDLLYRLARAGTLVYEPRAAVQHPTSTRRERTRSRAKYGRGMGAMLALHLQAGDPAAKRLISLYLRHQSAQALGRGTWGPVEAVLVLGGAAGPLARAGLRYPFVERKPSDTGGRRGSRGAPVPRAVPK